MILTEEEKSINGFILEVQEKNKINALRERFENIWKKVNETNNSNSMFITNSNNMDCNETCLMVVRN